MTDYFTFPLIILIESPLQDFCILTEHGKLAKEEGGEKTIHPTQILRP